MCQLGGAMVQECRRTLFLSLVCKGSLIWPFHRIAAVICVLSISIALCAQTPESPAQPAGEHSADFRIPDGTPVYLRFAQPVKGVVASPKHPVKKGAIVRLVVRDDVRVNGKVVIAKGAPARATVVKTWDSGFSSVTSGLTLAMDWVSTVTTEHALLRPTVKGPGAPFDVEALAMNGGVEVAPCQHRQRWLGIIFMTDAVTGRAYHTRNHIPLGARMTAYIDGGLALSSAAVDEANSELPVSNDTATLYVFRTKGKDRTSPIVSCNQIDVGSLGPQQMTVADLPPATYVCRAGESPGTELTVEKAVDYYLWLKRSGSTWELKSVSAAEGEDRSASVELLPQLVSKEPASATAQ